MSSFSSASFSTDAFSILAFDFGSAPPDTTQLLGGTFNDPYSYQDKQREAKRLREAQEEVIRLKQEQQELRLRELDALESKDKQTKRQLLAMERRKAELAAEVAQIMALIALMQQENQQRNIEAILVLSMAYPWLNIGGETMQ